jgi:hypothetical protein
MIEMDESEMSESDFTPDELRQVLKLLGPEIKDRLLIPKEPDG